MKKRHLAIALSIAMAVNLSVPGFAASEEERITVTEENEKSEGSEDSKEESEISEEPKEEIEKSESSEEESEKAEGSDGETEKPEESGSESEKTEESEDEKSEETEKENPEGDDEESEDDDDEAADESGHVNKDETLQTNKLLNISSKKLLAEPEAETELSKEDYSKQIYEAIINGGDIKLTEDVTLDGDSVSGNAVRIPKGVKTSIDFDGHTITLDAERFFSVYGSLEFLGEGSLVSDDANQLVMVGDYSTDSGELLTDGASFVISGDIDLESMDAGVFIAGDNSYFKMSSGSINTDKDFNIAGNGSYTKSSTIILEGDAEIRNSSLYCIYHPQGGDSSLTIKDDVVVEGGGGIQMCAGSLNISGDPVITGTYNGALGVKNKSSSDGSIVDSAALGLVNREGYGGLKDIEISGGTFTAPYAPVKYYGFSGKEFSRDVDTELDSFTISGGSFKSEEDSYPTLVDFYTEANPDSSSGGESDPDNVNSLGSLIKAGKITGIEGGSYEEKFDESYLAEGYTFVPTTDSEYPYAVVEKDDIKFNTEINGKRSTKATLDLNPNVAKSSLTAEIIQSGPKDVEIDTSALGEYTWTITPVEGNIPATVNASGTEATFTASEIGRATVEVSCDALEDVILAEFDLTVVDSTKGTGAAEDGITEVKAEVGETAPPSVSGITEEQKSQLETDSKTAVDNAVDSVCNNADVHSSTVETTVRTDTIDNVPAPSENEKIVLGTSQTLNNVSLEAVTQTDEDGNIISVAPVIRSVTYEIVPTYQMLTTDGQPVTETTVFDLIKGQVRMTFRIPVPLSVTDRYARVEHISDDYGTSTGYYTVETGENGGKYITYTTDHFSTFKLTFTNDRPSGGGSHGGSSKGSPLTSRATYYADGTVKTNDGIWHEDEKGWWFELPDGTWPVSMWRECPWNGVMNWYHFNAEGYLDSGWFTDADGNVYYLHDVHDGNFGYMYKGTKLIEGANYYFTEEEVENGLPEGALAR